MSRAQLLKDAILQAAIQGKLTEQLDTDSSVESAILKAYKEKEVLGIRHVNALPIDDKEIPYDLPLSWKWARIADVVYNRDQKKPEATFSYIDIGSIDNVHQKLNKEETIIEAKAAPSRARKVVKTGDVLYATVRPYLHNICIIDREFTYEPIASTGFAVMVCHSCILNKYLLYYLISPSFDNYANATDNAKGVAYPAINDKKLYAGLIPLPPIEEQKRIVERVDELLAKVDEFEKIEIQLANLKQNFPSDLRSAILQAAMQGKLTEQLDTDSSVDELVKEIDLCRQNMIKRGIYKPNNHLKEMTDSDIPFDIPDTWRWVRLGYCSTYGQTKEKATAEDCMSDIWSLDLEDIEKVTGNVAKKWRAKERQISGDKIKFYKGNILYSKLRPYLLKILIADADGICSPELIPFDMIGDISNRYIMWVLRSPHIDFTINSVTYGVKMPRVSTDTMVNLLIPLPPIEEQQRIVEKLDKLIPLCDELNG